MRRVNSKLIVKICGLTDEAALDAALEGGADMVGFVFFAQSPRHLSLQRASVLAARVGGRAQKVALTVDADDDTLRGIVAAIAPDWLQLHGREEPARAQDVRRKFGRPVMKAIGVCEPEDLGRVADYHAVDALLLDARPPRDATRPGGNGASFDWNLLRDFRPVQTWMLSGGLTSANVADALARSAAPGVDVSSGVERRPGVKDPALILEFISTARRASA